MLPVQIITREEIQRSGLTTAAQVMAQVPANFGGFVDALSIGNANQPGLASANLRGIGDGSTLVLLNGRRVANYAFNGATVDLNSIPLANIERIEILKDGGRRSTVRTRSPVSSTSSCGRISRASNHRLRRRPRASRRRRVAGDADGWVRRSRSGPFQRIHHRRLSIAGEPPRARPTVLAHRVPAGPGRQQAV